MNKEWIPLISRLVWPVFIVLLLIVFHSEVRQFYNIVIDRVEQGGEIRVGGFLELGELVNRTEISQLSFNNISVQAVGGAGGVIRKGGLSELEEIRRDLRENPSRTIDTLLITDGIRYSVRMLKQYVSTLGLKFVVFQKGDQFEGWINAGSFIAQLPSEEQITDNPEINIVSYEVLKRNIVGIRDNKVTPDTTVMEVLQKMRELHVDALPVVGDDGRWQFFTIRGDILSQLITSVLIEEDHI